MLADVRRKLSLARQAGPRATVSAVREAFLSSSELMLGLRCDLRELPAPQPAKVPLEMRPRDSRSFTAFAEAIEDSGGEMVLDLRDRQDMCEAGVRELFVAETADGGVAYAQWCIDPSNLPRLQALSNNRYRPLGDREVLLEGAYTFAAYRGIGAMADGMGQLLRIARDRGATTAYTYVASTNVPSLRGCAKVGFDLNHTRTDVSRFGRRRSTYAGVDDTAAQGWRTATGR